MEKKIREKFFFGGMQTMKGYIFCPLFAIWGVRYNYGVRWAKKKKTITIPIIRCTVVLVQVQVVAYNCEKLRIYCKVSLNYQELLQ